MARTASLHSPSVSHHREAPGAVVGGDDPWTALERGELTLREQRRAISRAMAAAGGNQSEAARRLGMSRGTLIDRLHRYGIGSPASGDE